MVGVVKGYIGKGGEERYRASAFAFFGLVVGHVCDWRVWLGFQGVNVSGRLVDENANHDPNSWVR